MVQPKNRRLVTEAALDTVFGQVDNTSDLDKPIQKTVAAALDGKVDIAALTQALDKYIPKAVYEAQIADVLRRLNAAEIALGQQGGGTTPVTPPVDPTAGTVLVDRNFSSMAATTNGGTGGAEFTDPGNNFRIATFATTTTNGSGSTPGLGLWNTNNSVTRWYFLLATAAVPGTGAYAVTLKTIAPTTSTTVAYPNAVVGANTAADPTSWYGASLNNTGQWRIIKTVNGTQTTLATSATTADTDMPMTHTVTYDPATGKIDVFARDATAPIVTVTDPSPLTGRFAGTAYRSYTQQAVESAAQGLARLTIKTYVAATPDPVTPDPPSTNLLAASAYDAGPDLSVFSTRGSSGGTVLTTSSDWASVGTTSVKATFNAGASIGSGVVTAAYIPVTPGCYYKGTVTVQNGSGTQKLKAVLEWTDSNKITIPGSPEGNPTTVAVGSAVTLKTEVTAPLRAAFVRVAVKNDTTTRPENGSYYYADAFTLEKTTTTPKPDTSPFVLAYTKPASGIFPPASSYWKVDVSNAPLHPDSANLIAHLAADDVATQYGGISVYNTSQYNSTNYVVAADHPTMTIGFCDAQRKGYTPGELYAAGSYRTFCDVPVPTGAVSGGGGDGHITIFRPSTGTLWEFWQFWEDRQQDNGYGGVPPLAAAAGDFTYKPKDVVGKDWRGFSATWGGRIDNVATNPGVFPGYTGTSASGLSYADGTISFADLDAGVIDHALAVSITYPRSGIFSWPARRTDGYVNSVNNIPEGLRLRMDPSINFDTQYTSLHPLARMVAKSLQKYGGIVTDKSNGVEVEGESSAALRRIGQPDPWTARLNGTPGYEVMRNFPWTRMQALPLNYLKP